VATGPGGQGPPSSEVRQDLLVGPRSRHSDLLGIWNRRANIGGIAAVFQAISLRVMSPLAVSGFMAAGPPSVVTVQVRRLVGPVLSGFVIAGPSGWI
jgi:hypothetical protein